MLKKYLKKIVTLVLIVGILCTVIPTDNAKASGYWEEQGLSEGHDLRSSDYYGGKQGIAQVFKYGFKFYDGEAPGHKNTIKTLVGSSDDYEDGFNTDYDYIIIGTQDNKCNTLVINNPNISDYLKKRYLAETSIDSYNWFYDALPVGAYRVTMTTHDRTDSLNGINFTSKDFYFQIVENDEASVSASASNAKVLQGTKLNAKQINDLCSANIRDALTGETIRFTTDALKMGTYIYDSSYNPNYPSMDVITALQSLQTNYSYDDYIAHKTEYDAKNTWTVTFKYWSANNKQGTFTGSITLIPVFPEFHSSTNQFQVQEGYEPIYNANGEIIGFTDKTKQETVIDKMGVAAFTEIENNPDELANDDVHEQNDVSLYKVTYADGSTEGGALATEYPTYITTADGSGLYGDDLNAKLEQVPCEEDEQFITYKYKDTGEIYPYRGEIEVIFKATNSFGNSIISDYNGDVYSEINERNEANGEPPALHDPNGDEFAEDNYPDMPTDMNVKPQGNPVINAGNRWMYTEEEIDKDNLFKDNKIDAVEYDMEMNEVNIKADVIVSKVDKIDKYGNKVGTVYEAGEDELVNGTGGLQMNEDGLYNDILDTNKQCSYEITFWVKGSNGKSNTFTITMYVVDTEVKNTYFRFASLEYAIKIPENLDENGNNKYYDDDSIWMNNKEVYARLMHALCSSEISKVYALDSREVIQRWEFTHEQVLETQSWTDESGIADAGNEVPEGTLVTGALFEDERGMYIIHDKPNHEAGKYHTYIKEGTLQYGMHPSKELSLKWYNTWYEAGCCTTDNLDVTYQGKNRWACYIDEDGWYIFQDKNTGLRMKASPDKSQIVEDTRDYSVISVPEYATRCLLDRYADVINSNPKLALLKRVVETFDNFTVNQN